MSNVKMILFPFVMMIALINSVHPQTIRLMTYNIRYDNPEDGDNSWENRKDKMAGLLNFYEPAFLGIQEGLLHQVQFLDNSLPAYDYIGVGRDDGKQKGEYCAIFFDTTLFRVIIDSTFWLSETPDIPSSGWDANLHRICTYGLFENLKTKRKIWVMNTHFDHRGRMARENSARLLAERIGQINEERLPLVLMGDFNATPEDAPIRILKSTLSDAAEISEKPVYGPPGTSNGFRKDAIVRRIDYVLCTNVKVVSYAHIDDRRNNNGHVSDHLPVLTTIGLTF
jgi:endonuclease/exonuclease/phosphatase family metal-dependent hydrolase